MSKVGHHQPDNKTACIGAPVVGPLNLLEHPASDGAAEEDCHQDRNNDGQRSTV